MDLSIENTQPWAGAGQEFGGATKFSVQEKAHPG